MDLLIKQNIKGYDLRERIGAGGFGAVYKAYQSTVGREVAIKIILPGLANQPDFIRRFESEAQLVARLEHPHITPLYDYWRDPEGAYLVMRWLRGGSLQDALQNGPFEPRAAALLLDQIAGALSLAHRNGVIHRDIKPGNILLDEDGNAYLTDFGIAKDLNLPTNYTQQDAVIGSLDYISPEQARSEVVTPPTDIYSLGVTMYEVITGHHPFENMSSVERLYKHINDPLPDIAIVDGLDASEINRVIQRATAKDPDQRFPDGLAFAAEFREAMGLNRASTTVVELLTQREQEVLQLIIDGLSNREIAQKLTVTLGTVKWYVNQIYKKLGVRSRVQAIVRARELELIVKPGDMRKAVDVPTEDFYPENPYKGLRAFEAADNQDFFGREKVTAKLLERLGDTGEAGRFLAVVGPSGSGKSSLVKAGLIPAIWRGELPGADKWFVVEMMPGPHPLDELEIALTRIAANQSGNLNEQLRRDNRGLARTAGLILPNDGSELVLVIDQFEEIFTLLEDEATRVHFLELLHVAVSEPRSRVRVVITLRADFFDRPLHYPQFGELVRRRMETIMPLSAEELERAITRPAERVGVSFELGLVSAIIDDVNYQPGALPLLQYALTELFEQRQGRLLTREAYQAIGGTVGALAKRAEEVYLSMNETEQALIRQMFLRLVTLGEGKEDTRRRIARSELQAISDDDSIDEIIDTFVGYRLLSVDTDPGTRTPTVEVAHEALLREWERLGQWLHASRDDIRQGRLLSRAAEEWNVHQQDASYLLRGSRLEQIEKWQQSTDLVQTPLEREFVTVSFQQRVQELKEEQARQAREARLERRSRNFLRGLVAVFALAAVISGGLSVLAFNLNSQSQESAAGFRSIALASGARDALDNGRPDEALALALEGIQMESPPFNAQQTFSDISSSSWIKKRLLISDARVRDSIYHPNGDWIISSSWDGRAIIWDRATGEEIKSVTVDGASQLTWPTVSPNQEIVAFGSFEGELWLWNIVTDEITKLKAGEGWHGGPQFTADGSQLIAMSEDTINIWDMETLTIQRSFVAHPGVSWISSIRFNQDESQLITAAGDGYVRAWDLASGELVRELDHNVLDSEESFFIFEAQLLHNDEWLLTAGSDHLTLWDWQSGEIIWMNENGGSLENDLILDEEWFISGTDGSTQLYHTASGALVREYWGHAGGRSQVDMHPQGDWFITANNDGMVIEWPLWWEGSQQIMPLPVWDIYVSAMHPTRPLVALAQDPAGSGKAFIDGSLSSIYIVNTETGEVVRELTGHRGYIGSLAFTPDGHHLLSGDDAPDVAYEEQQLYVWDWERGERIAEFSKHVGWVLAIDISPDGTLVASGDAAGTNIFIWYLQTGEVLQHLMAHEDWVQSVAFSPDGQWLYSTGIDGHVYRWNVTTGELIQEYGDGIGGVFGAQMLTLNSDGTRLVASFDGVSANTFVWDVESGELILTLPKGGVFEFNADDGLGAIYSYTDGTITLWDMNTGQLQHQYAAYRPNTFGRITFSSDYSQIISTANGHLVAWDIPDTFVPLETWATENRYIPDFTCEQRELYIIEPLCEEGGADS